MKTPTPPAFLRRDEDKRPFLLELRSSTGFISAAVALAIFTDLFLYAVIIPVIPFALGTRAGVPVDNVQYWVSVLLAVYGAALLAGSPICGLIADRTTTRRAPLLFGLVVFAGATALLAIGTSVALLIVGRILQGLSGAIVWTTGLALMVDTVGPKHVGRYMGYLSISVSLAILLGPLLGGVVFSAAGSAGYESVFAMCWVLIGADIVLRLLIVEKKVAVKWLGRVENADLETEDKSDETDAGKEASASVPIDEIAPQEVHDTSPDRPVRTKSISDTKEKTAPERAQPQSSVMNSPKNEGRLRFLTRIPLPPVLTLLSSRRLLVALYGTLVQASLITAFDSTLPLYAKHLFGYDSLGAGLLFLPIVLPNLLGPLVGHLVDKFGPRWFAVAGYLLAVPILVSMRFVDHNSLQQKVLLCALLALFGSSLVMAFAPLMAEISYVVEAKEKRAPGRYGRMGAYAQAYGLWNMAFAAGCLVGPIWGGLITRKAGWGTMGWTLGLLSGTTAVPILLWTGGWIGKGRRRNMSTREGWGEDVAANDEEDHVQTVGSSV